MKRWLGMAVLCIVKDRVPWEKLNLYEDQMKGYLSQLTFDSGKLDQGYSLKVYRTVLHRRQVYKSVAKKRL